MVEKVKVAIAEDDFRVADIHEKFLSKIEQVQIVGKALNAKETMALLAENKIDLLLLDIYMPDQLGTDLLTTIRESYPSIDIVMITAATEKSFLEKAMRNGVQHYLIKPVKMERFIEIINSYIITRNLFQERDQIDQGFADRMFQNRNAKPVPTEGLPKGIDPITLQKVIGILDNEDKGISADQFGKRLGASRTTSRRYLEYLISIGQCRPEIEYGIVGRPERLYYKV